MLKPIISIAEIVAEAPAGGGGVSIDYCTQLAPIINIIKTVMDIVRFAIPCVLIVIGTFDIFKAVVASKEDEIKAAQKLLIKRVMYAVVIFLIPTIVMLVLNIVADSGAKNTSTKSFWTCWNN